MNVSPHKPVGASRALLKRTSSLLLSGVWEETP